MTNFEQQVFYILRLIPQGKVTTYGNVANYAGYPGYARHVGRLLSSLPRDTQLPWYRVINSQGRISLTGTGLNRQKQWLDKDGVKVSELGKVNLKQYLWQP